MKTILSLFIFCVYSTLISKAQNCSSCNSTGWVSSLLVGQTQTYSVPHLSGATIVWVVTGNLSIVAGQGTSTVTIQATAAGRGSLFVTRFLQGHSACADFITININSRTPPRPTNLDIIIEPCETVLIRVNPLVSNATGYNFYLNGVLKYSGPLSDYYISLVIPEIQPGVHNVCVSAFNSFGTSSLYCETFEVTCVGGAGRSHGNHPDVYPIPAINFLTVEKLTKEVEFVSIDGTNRTTLSPINGLVDVSVLKPGVYITILKNEDGSTRTLRTIVDRK